MKCFLISFFSKIYFSGFEAKASLVLRTEVIEYILTQINEITKIQKIIRGFIIYQKFQKYLKNCKILVPLVRNFFLVWSAKNFLKKLRAQQVNFFNNF